MMNEFRSNQNASEALREKRKALELLRYQGVPLNEEMGGNPHGYSPVQLLTRHVMEYSRHSGLSGEDTMTLLAYEALCQLEQLHVRLLLDINLRTHPPIVVDREVPK